MLKKKERILSVLDKMPNGICIKDKHFRYQYVNQAYVERVLGISSQKKNIKEVLGKCASELSEEKWIEELDRADNLVLHNKESIVFEIKICRNHYQRSVHIFESPLIDEEKGFQGVICVERQMKGQANILREMLKSYNQLAQNYNMPVNRKPKHVKEILSEISKGLLRMIHCDAMALHWYDEEKESLVYYASKGVDRSFIKHCENLTITQLELQQRYKSKASICRIDNSKEEDDRQLALMGMKYVGKYPIKFNERVLGIICIAYKDNNFVSSYADYNMNNLCNKVALLIKNAEFLDQIEYGCERIKLAEEKLEDFFNTTKDLMCILDEDYHIKRVNSEWYTKLGWSKEELIGYPIEKIIKGDLFISERREQVYISTMHCMCKDGSMKLISWNIVALPHVHLVIATGRDITESKALRLRNNYLEKAIEEERIKNEFFANISHEFKTPINIILSSMKLLDAYFSEKNIEYDFHTDSSKYTYKIKKNAYRLLRLANNLIDTTKLETGNFSLNFYNYDIVTIIEDVTLTVAEYVYHKGITVLFDTEIEEKVILCDVDSMERIMLNLLVNAVKYTPRGGEIMVKISVENQRVIVSVKDNGTGIESNRFETLFDNYTKSHECINHEQGTGTGLGIVKALVELHGGTITVNSILGQGAEFIFDIPDVKTKGEVRTRDSHNCPMSIREKCMIEFS